jgi:type IV pilus assembly protein PilM
MAFFSRRLSPIGLDIGTGSIKMAQLQWGAERNQVLALGQHELPQGLSSPEDRMEAIRFGIGELLNRRLFLGRNVVLSLNGQQLFVQNVRLPRLSAEELGKVVRWEAEERLPDEFGPAEVRHLVAGEVRSGSGASETADSRYEVILLACRRKVIDDLVNLLSSLRMRPIAIDIQACALVRATQLLLRRKTDEQTGLLFLDVGAGMSTAVVTRGSEIILIKQFPIGGQSMDRLVGRKLNLSLEDAGLARRQWRGGETEPVDSDLARAVGESVRSEIESLASEILMCIRYHSVTFRGNRLGKTVLYGGEADTRLADQLSARIDTPCVLGDPFQGLELSPAAMDALAGSRRGQWVIALGLCSKLARARAA